MLSTGKSTTAEEAIPLLVAEIYQLAGEFRNLGNRIASRAGQTQARWQVLSVVSEEPRTVAQIARRLGYARQSVQRTADQLVREGLAEYKPNPDHAKSPLFELTNEGITGLAGITREAARWHRQLSAELKSEEAFTTLRVLRQLRSAVEIGSSRKRVGKPGVPAEP